MRAYIYMRAHSSPTKERPLVQLHNGKIAGVQ
jgi:hypothetical protein